MKKLVALLLALLLCTGAALAEGTDAVGVWYLDEIIANGISMEPSAFEMDTMLELFSDGTARRTFADTEESGVWAMNGGTIELTMAGQAETYVLQDGKLTGQMADAAGVELVLVRERIAKTLPDVRADAVLADFNGAWYATLVEFMGMSVPVAEMNMSMVITLADGMVIIDEGAGEEAAVTSGTAAMDGSTLVISAEDGAIIPLQLRVNGEMTYTAMEDDVNTVIHFEKVQ